MSGVADLHWVLTCSEPGCGAARYELADGVHGRTIRRAIKDGWTATGDETGCLCGCSGQLCPDHSDPAA